MERFECEIITRELAKTYLDVFLTSVDSVEEHKVKLYAVTAISLAIKVQFFLSQFNESKSYPLSQAMADTENQYSPAELIEAESEMLKLLRFDLDFATPTSYIELCKEMIPMENGDLYTHLEAICEYCAMLSTFVGLAAGEVLFSVLYYSMMKLGRHDLLQIVKAIGHTWPNIEQRAQQIA